MGKVRTLLVLMTLIKKCRVSCISTVSNGATPNSTLVATQSFRRPVAEYDILLHPLPSPSHSRYPFHTPGGGDTRWVGPGEAEEEGLQWVGCILSVVLCGPFVCN
jgi:hypothetical protein